MDLSTTYLGLPLRSPLIVGSCGLLSENISHLRQMEDAGAGAVVLHSLFEEQLEKDRLLGLVAPMEILQIALARNLIFALLLAVVGWLFVDVCWLLLYFCLLFFFCGLFFFFG